MIPDADVVEERPDGCLVLRQRSDYINEDTYLYPAGHPDCLVRVVTFTGNAPHHPHIMSA